MMTAQVKHLATLVAGVPEMQTAWWGGDDGVGSGGCRGPARCACGDGPRRFVTGVLMRCRECAAEVAVTARVCSRCGAPIVGQQPPVVADTVVAAVSDAAGKAVPAGVAGQALPEPYVPGSGDRVPAELRLVLAGYAGIAGGLLAGALACATALVFFFFIYDIDQLDRYSGLYDLLFFLALLAFLGGFRGGLGWGLGGCSRAPGAYPIFHAAAAAQRSTYGHGDGLQAWWAHADTRHHPRGRRRPPVPVAVRGSSRVVAECRHAGTR